MLRYKNNKPRNAWIRIWYEYITNKRWQEYSDWLCDMVELYPDM